jgi:succinyl-diaminopimelate desuccinylase
MNAISSKAEGTSLEAIEQIAEEMIAFLQELVRIPTVNPPGDEYSACAELIGRKLNEFGYDVQYVAAEGSPEHTLKHPRINVVGRLSGQVARPLLHFNGHFDVVPVGDNWSVDPFSGLLQNGKLYGRGTADMKAGIAASIYAIEALRRAGVRFHGTIEQSGTVDEESGGFAGVAYLAQRGFIEKSKTDFVIITEPTNVDHVYIGHRGVYWFKVIQYGRIGHGSMPFLGVNAADHLGEVVHEINHWLKPRLASRKTSMPVEPAGSRFASININSVFGGQPEDGTQTPCVIDRAGAIFDRRFLAEERFEEVKAEIQDMLDRLSRAHPSFRYELQDLMVVLPTHTEASSPVVHAVAHSIGDILGRESILAASPGTYDQKHVVRIGGVKDCIAYGPGLLEQAHQPDEYVAIQDLVDSAKIMALSAMRLVGVA